MRLRRLLPLLAGGLIGFGQGDAAGQSAAIRAVREYRVAHEGEVVAELLALLRLPNVAADLPAIRRNAEALVAMMERRGIRARLLETGGPPYVFGQLSVPGATRTVLFYAHYDGQPVDTGRWVGQGPYEPVLRDRALETGGRIIDLPREGRYDPDWRVYARSASDDKSPIVALMAALDALRASGLGPAVNLKFIFEGDEEAGSPNLGRLVREHGGELAADLVVSADGPSDRSGLPTLYFGVRGIVGVELTVYGPLRPLHSGHYGNWAPNPAMRLAELLATMKDPETGRVLVDGFYDDVVPLSEFEMAALREAPDDDEEQMRAFGIARPEAEGRRLELINLPSLNVRGLRSGWVGDQARTIVPDVAIASIDMRLVKDIDPAQQADRLIAHIERQGYHVVRDEPDADARRRYAKLARVVISDGYPAFRTPMGLPVSRALIAAVEGNTGRTAVKLPTLGGSVPLYQFTDVLGIPVVGIPIVNHDNNQHSPNENLRLGNLWSGIEILAAAMLID
jgi:acetylornithine deacetylase/succinyl-diaminopimelate desuccinylase-like protein